MPSISIATSKPFTGVEVNTLPYRRLPGGGLEGDLAITVDSQSGSQAKPYCECGRAHENAPGQQLLHPLILRGRGSCLNCVSQLRLINHSNACCLATAPPVGRITICVVRAARPRGARVLELESFGIPARLSNSSSRHGPRGHRPPVRSPLGLGRGGLWTWS